MIAARVGDAIEHDETIGWHLEQAHQILGLLLHLDVGVTDHPEGALPLDLVAWEQAARVEHDHLLEGDEPRGAGLGEIRQADEALGEAEHFCAGRTGRGHRHRRAGKAEQAARQALAVPMHVPCSTRMQRRAKWAMLLLKQRLMPALAKHKQQA